MSGSDEINKGLNPHDVRIHEQKVKDEARRLVPAAGADTGLADRAQSPEYQQDFLEVKRKAEEAKKRKAPWKR